MKVTLVNQSTTESLKSSHKQVIDEAILAYFEILNTEIINIRLMGSVGRNDFRKLHSDIDFIAITKTEISNSSRDLLSITSKNLSTKYSIYRKVDLEFIEKDKISRFRNIILTHDSISIYGTDLFPIKYLEIDSIELAKETTPNFDILLNEYKNGVSNTKNKHELMQFSRWIGKDLLKAFRGKLIRDHGIYEVESTKITKALIEKYGDRQVFTILLNAYLNPLDNASELSKILELVKNEKQEFENFA